MNCPLSITCFVHRTRTSHILKSFLSNDYSRILRNGNFKFTICRHNKRTINQLNIFQAFSTFAFSRRVHYLFQRPRVLCSKHSRCSSQGANKLNRKTRKTFYDILEVQPSATQSEIKSAYYELSMRYHPDVSKSTEARDSFTGM